MRRRGEGIGYTLFVNIQEGDRDDDTLRDIHTYEDNTLL